MNSITCYNYVLKIVCIQVGVHKFREGINEPSLVHLLKISGGINMDNYGIITLLPPLFVIVFALFTRKTFESLILGAILGFVIAYKTAFFGPFMDAIYAVLMDGDTVWVILTCGLFGSLIALLEKSKGSFGFSKLMQKHADSPKKSLIASWILGIIIFVDDYLNVLTIGSSMRSVTDKNKVPREMLAYVIDSTGAPICVLIPFSTWVIFFSGVFADQAELAFLGSGSEIYYHLLPYIFYGWTAAIVVPLVILGIIPTFGPMKKAYERVNSTGMVYSQESAKYNTSDAKDDTENGKLINFILPIIILILITFWQGDLLLGVIGGIITGVFLYLPTKAMSFDDFSNALLRGFADMIPMLAIIVAAFTIKLSMEEINLPNYIINAVLPYMKPAIFPALTFILVSMLSFITGSNWGIPAVTVPIIAPLAIAAGANPYLTLAAIISGGTFGSHACFYSDCTVLTSSAARIENLEHAFTQFPFALISAAIAVILYLIFGFVM